MSGATDPNAPAAEMTKREAFAIYGMGIVFCSVCTSLSDEEAAARLNREHPTGITSPWAVSTDKTFRTGEPNPHPCEQQPETHRHILFHR